MKGKVKRLNSLQFFACFAQMQLEKGGVGQSVKMSEIINKSKLPTTVIYHHINSLIEQGFIKKVKRGYYHVQFNISTVAIGMSVITYWDMLEFNKYKDDFMKQFRG